MVRTNSMNALTYTSKINGQIPKMGNPRETSKLQKLRVNSIFNSVSVILGGDAENVQQVQIQFRKVTHSRLLHVQIKEHFGS
jgi:hypothetical protein